MDLTNKKCLPCHGVGRGGSVSRLGDEESSRLLPLVPGWTAEASRQIAKRFVFVDFAAAMAFVNAMAALAEAEGHHPDFTVRYGVVDVVLRTHDVSGLSENDFILAAKIDALPPSRPGAG